MAKEVLQKETELDIVSGDAFQIATDWRTGKGSSIGMHIVTDLEEGIEYLVVSTEQGVAITPRLTVGYNGNVIPKIVELPKNEEE